MSDYRDPNDPTWRNAALFTGDMTPVFWTGGLQGSGPPRLADRLDTQRAALAVPRQMDALAGWQPVHRAILP